MRNITDLDSLIQELNAPKEEIYKAQFNQVSDGSAAGALYDSPEAGEEFPGESHPEQISDDVAKLSGKMIAGTIDTVFSTGCSLYAKQKDSGKYEATPKQINELETAWAAVAKKYNYKIEDSPWFTVIILLVAVYLPILMEAKEDRRYYLMNKRMDEMQEQINNKADKPEPEPKITE